jgi:hypothetical protein
LTATASELQRELNATKSQTSNAKKFAKIVDKYTDIMELNYEIIHEFIDKIIVHETDKETNTRYIEIHYNFAGQIDSGATPTTTEYKRRNCSAMQKTIAV